MISGIKIAVTYHPSSRYIGQPVLAGTFADDEDDVPRTIVYPASWRSVLVNADVLSMFFTVRIVL